MKIVINSKELKEAITAVLLKGKWNLGQTLKSHQLNSEVILEVDVGGNEATYVQYKLNVSDVKVGKVCLDTDTLVKYLKGNSELTLTYDNSKGVLSITTPTSIITLNTLENHSHSDSIKQIKGRASEGRWADYINGEWVDKAEGRDEISISNATNLKTILRLTGEELKEAFKSCEIVGSGIFKLDYIGENRLCVSSSYNNQSMLHNIEVDEANGPQASVEFTAPVHLLLNETTVIAFNNDSPLFILNDKVKMLRAPRFEGDT